MTDRRTVFKSVAFLAFNAAVAVYVIVEVAVSW